MPFTVSDFEDLIRILQERPEWRERLRALILPEEILTLPQLVRENTEAIRELRQMVMELVEAQRRTDERLEQGREETREEIRQLRQAIAELVEVQRRTDERVAELAEAQRRTDERIERYQEETRAEFQRVWEAHRSLEQRLEAHQAENRQRFDRLERKVDALASEVSKFWYIVGTTVEEEAQTSIPALLRQQGYTAPKAGYPVSIDTVGEVDVVLPVTSPQGESLTVVAEVKVRLGERAVVEWANRMRSEEFRRRLREAGVPGPYLVYMYAIRVDPAAIEQAHAEGIGMMSGRGILVEPRESLPEV